MKKNLRIDILDGFRFLAILLVILYHYLSAFADVQGLYPYGPDFAKVPLFEYGFLGVQFFFIISGFVILMTLERSAGLVEFLKKRFIRLYPALLFCSVCTFALVRALDPDNVFQLHRSMQGFLPSLTFINGFFWERAGFKEASVIDGAYWSLLTEVKFYLFAGCLYFFNRKRFVSNWTTFSCFSLIVAHTMTYLGDKFHLYSLSQAASVFNILFISEYVAYFTVGMIFYKLFSKEAVSGFQLSMTIAFLVVEATVLSADPIQLIFFISFLTLFVLFIYRPSWLKVFSNPIIAQIGVVSYPLYLIHQYVGLLAINRLYQMTGLNSIVCMVLVAAGCIVLAFLIQNLIEKPVQKELRRMLFKPKGETTVVPVEMDLEVVAVPLKATDGKPVKR